MGYSDEVLKKSLNAPGWHFVREHPVFTFSLTNTDLQAFKNVLILLPSHTATKV